MPAMHLMRVDLPAPLSPTRAMTSPRETWKSTSYRACTAPKLFETPFSSKMGVSVTLSTPPPGPVDGGGPPAGGPGRRRGAAEAAPRSPSCLADARLRAQRGVLADADLTGLQEAVVEDHLDVVLGDRLRGQQHGRDVTRSVVRLAVDEARLGLFARGQRNGQLGGRVGLLLDRLVDGHALVAGEDVLDPLRRRVLPGDRELLELARLDRRDGRVAQAVVGGEHAVDLVVGLLQHLLEDRQRLLVVPVGHGLIGDLRGLARAVQR